MSGAIDSEDEAGDVEAIAEEAENSRGRRSSTIYQVRGFNR